MIEHSPVSTQDNTIPPESLPQIRYVIQFVFGPHVTAEHAHVLEDPIKDCDIAIFEGIFWNQGHLDYMNRVSSGTASLPEESTTANGNEYDGYKEYDKQLLKYLHGSGKRVFFADIPEGHPLQERYIDLIKKGRRIPKDIDFEVAIDTHADFVRTEAEFDKDREEYIATEINRILVDLSGDENTTEQSDHTHVLVSLGSFHTRVSHRLRELGYVVPIPIMRRHTEIFSYSNEETRTVMFNKPLDRHLLARGLIETIITRCIQREYRGNLHSLTADMNKINLLMRRLFGKFSYEDCERIWQERRVGHGALDSFRTILAEKGISFPTNEQEIDALS